VRSKLSTRSQDAEDFNEAGMWYLNVYGEIEERQEDGVEERAILGVRDMLLHSLKLSLDARVQSA